MNLILTKLKNSFLDPAGIIKEILKNIINKKEIRKTDIAIKIFAFTNSPKSIKRISEKIEEISKLINSAKLKLWGVLRTSLVKLKIGTATIIEENVCPKMKE